MSHYRFLSFLLICFLFDFFALLKNIVTFVSLTYCSVIASGCRKLLFYLTCKQRDICLLRSKDRSQKNSMPADWNLRKNKCFHWTCTKFWNLSFIWKSTWLNLPAFLISRENRTSKRAAFHLKQLTFNIRDRVTSFDSKNIKCSLSKNRKN